MKKVGQYWLSVLNDKHSRRNAYAGKVLSRIRYYPAIPDLIRNIHIADVTVSLYPGGEVRTVRRSLAEFGNAAIPDIIDAYLSTTNGTERRGFTLTIQTGKTESFAITYLTGLHAQGDKRVTDQILREFKQELGQ